MKAALWAVAVFAVYMSFTGLGNVAFWDDEIETAWMGRAIAEHGKPFAWNGRNIHDYGMGSLLNEDLESVYPNGAFYIGALSFKLFGVSEAGGRMLFVFLGVLSLGVFLLLLRLEIPDNPGIRLAAFSVYSLSPVYLLHVRNMRYYAAALLLAVLTVWLYRLYIKKQRESGGFPWSIWGAALCGGLTFFMHFLAGLSFIAALGICHLVFHARRGERHLWAAVGLLGVFCVYYLFANGHITADFETNERLFSSFYKEESRLARISSILPLYLRFINPAGFAPWIVSLWIVWIGVARVAGRGSADDKTAVFYGTLGLAVVFVCGLMSPQQEYDHYAATRFYITAFPFLAVATGFFCVKLLKKQRVVGIIFTFLLLNTTMLSYPFGIQNHPTPHRNYRITDLPAPAWKSVNIFSFENAYTRWTLPAMAAEFHGRRHTFVDTLTQVLNKHGKQDEVISVWPSWSHYNLLWYLDKKFLFLYPYSEGFAHSPEVLDRHGAVIRTKGSGYTPDWIVIFGPAEKEVPYRILNVRLKAKWSDLEEGRSFNFWGKRYVIVKRTNDLYFPVWRPELYWHSFKKIRVDKDPRRGAAVVFRLVETIN